MRDLHSTAAEARMTIGRRIITVVDYLALAIALLFCIALLGNAIIQGLFFALRATVDSVASLAANRTDRTILIFAVVCVIWCWIRWKALTTRK
jgi:hypothetical protein